MLNGMERTMRYKMYKAKKQWLFAGMGTLMLTGVLLAGGSVTAQADTVTAVDTTQQSEAAAPTTGAADSSATTDPDTAQQALTIYLDAKNGAYTQAVNDYQQAASSVDAAKTAYDTKKADYETDLSNYKTEAATQAPTYETVDPATSTALKTDYDKVDAEYTDLVGQQATIATAATTANDHLQSAEDQLTTLHDALPDSVKTAGDDVNAYNATTNTVAAQLVADSTTAAYAAALTASPAGLTTMIKDATTLADQSSAKVLVTPDTTTDGTVAATLYGKTYTDQNGDGQITFEDDILPVAKADLTADLNKAQSGQTDFSGSYPEVVALFNYMKQVGDTALPYQDDGTVGRIESALANTASGYLSPNGSAVAKTVSSTYAAKLLSTIEGTKTQVENTVKTIYAGTGVPFDQTTFDAAFNQTLKEQAQQIYQSQTDQLLSIGQTLLDAFKAADAANDVVWQTSPGVYYATKDLSGRLQTVMDSVQQQVTEGTTALANVPATDHFLTMAYQNGDPTTGFTQTINSLWKTLYDQIDSYGMSLSPLMKTSMTSAAQSDPNTQKDAAGNTVYSPKFIQEHAAIFNAATALANAVTTLDQQSAVITNDFQGVLQKLLTIPGNFDSTLLDFSQLTPITPLTPEESQLEAPTPVTLTDVQVILTYVDDDNDGATVMTTTESITGNADGSVTWTATQPGGYDFATDQKTSGSVEIVGEKPIEVTIHVVHRIVTTKKVQKVTVKFVPATTDVDISQLPEKDVQTINWTLNHDLVTDTWTATPNKAATKEVDAPIIQGTRMGDSGDDVFFYVPDKTSVAGVNAAATAGKTDPTDTIQNVTRAITYYQAKVAPGMTSATKTSVPNTAPSAEIYPVEYIDVDTGEVVGHGAVTGNLGNIVKGTAPAGYVLVGNAPVTQTITKNTGVIVFPVTAKNAGGSEVSTPLNTETSDLPTVTAGGGKDVSMATDDSQATADASTTSDDRSVGSNSEDRDGQAVEADPSAETTNVDSSDSHVVAPVNGDTTTHGTAHATGVDGNDQNHVQDGHVAQTTLPQTNETDESAAVGLGVLSLSMLLGALGLKKRKQD
ncbi:KxYKxGKxW signal peptide domain-containing protein [Lactobacillus sp. LC28-10]|uniref:KxYKxGKxW signal peptide domain-containing protein n=1 Tax=Secundilactobacillus angelensis TaxID=2722706 RepID=A0ABX1KYR7_9LACO|nr:KxYKxGKxW signal peptide domain-containing protein [Secundilactobacillus angelensis]MCH5462509.1 KxYKxGKxW signal peptide domain-containing protein [Secundilactobacillus angelensis]NLR18300.1 KxYKxGKxW signal peptide domain-containing protein [Secundilactobacillus angelensis]